MTACQRLALPALLLVVTAALANAQPVVNLSVGQALDAWSAAGDDSSEHRTALAASIEQAFADARGRVWAGSELFTYSSPGDWTSLQAAGGGSWKFVLSKDRAALYAGGSGLVRRNGDAWTAANVTAGNAFANIAWTPRATASLRAGYGLDARRFDDLASLDHVQHTAFVSGLVNLPSRTTLIGEVTLGAKRYQGVDEAAVVVSGGLLPATAGGIQAGAGNGMTTGIGIGAGGTTGNGASGSQGFGGSTSVPTHLSALGVVSGPVTARLFTAYGRVAQSLAMRTSLALDVMHRATFGGVPPAVITTPVELFEDGLYDDPFASDATDARLTFKHIFANRIDVQVMGARLDKPFRMTPAYADDGYFRLDGAMRHDRVSRLQVATSLPVAPSRTGDWTVSLVVRGDYVKHDSNDAFAQYTSRAVTVGLAVGR
jgi:hypothetical protein